MSQFTFPNQPSECEKLLTSEPHDHTTRMRISAGYSLYGPPAHMIGVHLGAPTSILHRHEQNEKIHHFQVGDMFFVPTGASIESARPAATDTLYIHLSPTFVETTAESIGVDGEAINLHTALGTHDTLIAHIGREMLQELVQPGLGGRLYMDTLKTQLAIHLLRHYSLEAPRQPLPPSRPPRDLRHALDFIHTHLGENLTLNQVAAVEHLSPFHFSRLFKQIYGVAPHQYIIQKRVERAKELLRNPRLTVSEIALTVGFTNHSHLIRHFKRLTGTTPRQ